MIGGQNIGVAGASEFANAGQLPFGRAHYHFNAAIGVLFLY
jgi:hypothetical protein